MERIALETKPDRIDMRILDIVTPIGKGQRGLIVSPPRSGKTTLLQHIAEAVSENHPSMPLMFLLVDERPEEVTELRRSFPHADIMASSNDSDVKTHTRIAQLAMERAKRLVEAGHDVFMLLDSITRMARAFNNASTGGGKTGSGGIDLKAMEIPRKIFASARNTEEAGSLTIIATALIETGSRMDDYIFQEFKGTGNMEVMLDRKISDQLIFPAIDIFQSGTRREELILPPYMLEKISLIRRGLAGSRPIDAINRLIMLAQRFDTNFKLLQEIKLSAA
jgi:transcription termination factor Rho